MKLLELVSKNSKVNLSTLESEILSQSHEVYGSLYLAFEAAVTDEAVFTNQWKCKWGSDFVKIAVENVTPPYVSIGGTFDLTSYDSKGVEKIRKAIMKPRRSPSDSPTKAALLTLNSI